MKNVSRVIIVILFFVITLQVQAQDSTKDYFMGKWDVTVNGPNGEMKMVVGFEEKNNEIIGSIKDAEGKELYKVNSTTFGNESTTVNFNGSQGPVDLYLKKKDENHLTGDIMSMFSASGERIK